MTFKIKNLKYLFSEEIINSPTMIGLLAKFQEL